MKQNFPRIIVELMQERGINQLQLSEKLGVRQSQVSNWVNGKSLPGYYSIKMICIKLKVSADYLLELED
ncbi:MAG: helix-turn-helix domain-containing protein [Firmicutes bacterium]|nr:helix-turn-helix domain-containing protein [Bacillota bacterium]